MYTYKIPNMKITNKYDLMSVVKNMKKTVCVRRKITKILGKNNNLGMR